MKKLTFALVLAMVLLVGMAAVGPNTAIFRAIIVQNDAAIGNDLVIGGDTTIDGALTVTGGITGTNVLTTGNQTVGGVKTFTDTGTFSGAVTVGGGYGSTGCTLSAAGVLQCNGAATVDGALTAATVNAKAPVLVKDASYSVTAADTGSIIKSSGSITMTLPGAAAGLQYCIVNYDGGDLTIDFTDATDVALNEVNSPGDRVTNTTAYDNICLTAIDATNWVTLSSLGTWSDGN